jgi:hypothetical protein
LRLDIRRQSARPFSGEEKIGADMVAKSVGWKAYLLCSVLIDGDIAFGSVQADDLHGVGLAEAADRAAIR